MARSRKKTQTPPVTDGSTDEAAHIDALEHLRTVELPVMQMTDRLVNTPVWMLKMRGRNRVLAVAAAALLTVVLAFAAGMLAYTVPMFVSVFLVPMIPGAVLTTANVLPAEVNATMDRFVFMSVMPTLFMVLVLALLLGLAGFAVLRHLLRYLGGVWAGCVSPQEAVALVLARRVGGPAQVSVAEEAGDGSTPAKRTRHLSDLVDAAMTSKAEDAQTESAGTPQTRAQKERAQKRDGDTRHPEDDPSWGSAAPRPATPDDQDGEEPVTGDAANDTTDDTDQPDPGADRDRIRERRRRRNKKKK